MHKYGNFDRFVSDCESGLLTVIKYDVRNIPKTNGVYTITLHKKQVLYMYTK